MSVLTIPHLDKSTGQIAIERWQDVEDIIELNKVLQNTPQPSRRRGDWGRHVASIPNIIMERWLNEEHARGNVSIKLFGPEMDALVDRKLKDPDWKWLRTDGAASGILGFGS